jgi:hypothetical protein
MDDSRFTTRNRLVVEGEQLVLHSVSAGSLDLVSLADCRRTGNTPRRPRKRTFWQRIIHCSENIPASHPVSAVWVPSNVSYGQNYSPVSTTAVRA